METKELLKIEASEFALILTIMKIKIEKEYFIKKFENF